MTFSIEPYLPVDSWKIILGLAFIFSAALRQLLLVSLPFSLLLAADSYLSLSALEEAYHSDPSAGSKPISDAAGTFTLNARRFRAQRNFYIVFFALVMQGALWLAMKQARALQLSSAQLGRAAGTLYQKQREEDEKLLSERAKQQ